MGSNLNIYFKKNFKELIEKNGFPEGPIIEGDQRFTHWNEEFELRKSHK